LISFRFECFLLQAHDIVLTDIFERYHLWYVFKLILFPIARCLKSCSDLQV